MKFWNFWEKLDRENRVLKFGFLVLLIIVSVQSYLVIELYDRKTVVVLPPRVEKEFWVAGDTLSRSYLEQVAYFIADRLFNVSPENVKSSIDMILPFLTTEPENLKKIREQLIAYAREIIDNDIYQSFYAMKFLIGKDRNKRPFMRIEGILRRTSGDVYIGQRKAILNLFFKVKNGRLIIYELEKKP